MMGVAQRLGLARLGSGGSRFVSHGVRAGATRQLDEAAAQRWSPTGTRMGSNIIPSQAEEWQGVGLQVGVDVTGGGARMGQAFKCPSGTYWDGTKCVYSGVDPTAQAQIDAQGSAINWARVIAPLGVDLLKAGMSEWGSYAKAQGAYDIVRETGGQLPPWVASMIEGVASQRTYLTAGQNQQLDDLILYQRNRLDPYDTVGGMRRERGQQSMVPLLLLLGGGAVLAFMLTRR